MEGKSSGKLPAWMLRVCVFATLCGRTDAFFEWIKKAAPVPSSAPPAVSVSTAGLQSDTPSFEISVADEKILAEAKIMDLSPLDSCHFRVVRQLKAACGGLTEEELAKLGVALFNCQSEVEGRKTYPCTEDMSIKECTADMDSDTWNAYHIVSNRARAVCYATRQQQFRRQAELTVNSLISTATNQLDAMKDLKEGQRELREMTAASLDKMLEGHSALQLKQGALKEGQEQLDASINANLHRLAQEKALISTGQLLVAQLIQGITQRIENVSEQLKGQGTDVQEGHQAILEDLAEVRGRAQEIYTKMELNLNEVLQQQNSTAHFYMELMRKLERMNSTLGYMLEYLDSMQNRLEDRLHMIQGYLGWAGLSLCAVWTCVMHACYFLLSAVLLSFLQFPTFSRISLLITVPINAIAEVNQQSALDLVTLSLLLFTLTLGRWFLLKLVWVLSKLKGKGCSEGRPAPLLAPPTLRTPEKSPIPKSCQAASTPNEHELDCDLEPEEFGHDSFMTGDPCMVALSPSQLPKRGSVSLGTPSHSTPRLKNRINLGANVLETVSQRNLGGVLDVVNHYRNSSPNQSVTSNSSLSGRPLCSGITRLGQPCKKRAVLGLNFCRVHEGGHNSYNQL